MDRAHGALGVFLVDEDRGLISLVEIMWMLMCAA